MQNLYRFVIIALTVLMADPLAAEPAVASPDVYRQVRALDKVVEILRHHMGIPQASPMNLAVRNAQPHDVFFQAMTLFRKSDRLLFQMTRQKSSVPAVELGVYRPGDVLKLVLAARRNVDTVVEELGLTSPADHPETDTTKAPPDVFMAILAINRQLNLLLDSRFSPSEVYMEVSRAIGYAARQLARFPETVRIPPAPSVEPGRVPSDVFFRLLDCLEKISEIYRIEGLPSLEVDAEGVHKANITPGDVFEIASLVVARLDFLHKHFAIERLPRQPFYPGRVFPTDVYRQAGILQIQLEQLLAKMKAPKAQ